MILAADNAYSLGIAVFGTLGIALSAYVAIVTARTRREIKSPNGTKTGEAIYQLSKDVLDVRERQIEQHELGLAARAAQGEILAKLDEHGVRDDARFMALFDATGTDDPTV